MFFVLTQIARAATIFSVDEVVVFDELGSTLERYSCINLDVYMFVCVCVCVCALKV